MKHSITRMVSIPPLPPPLEHDATVSPLNSWFGYGDQTDRSSLIGLHRAGCTSRDRPYGWRSYCVLTCDSRTQRLLPISRLAQPALICREPRYGESYNQERFLTIWKMPLVACPLRLLGTSRVDVWEDPLNTISLVFLQLRNFHFAIQYGKHGAHIINIFTDNFNDFRLREYRQTKPPKAMCPHEQRRNHGRERRTRTLHSDSLQRYNSSFLDQFCLVCV